MMDDDGVSERLAIAVNECAAGPLSRDLVRRRLSVRPGESDAYGEGLTAAIVLCQENTSMEVTLVAALVGVCANLATYLSSMLECDASDVIDALDEAMTEQGMSV